MRKVYTILAVVDRIHRELRYRGERFSLAVFFGHFGGFELATTRLFGRIRTYSALEGDVFKIAVCDEMPRSSQRLSVAAEIGRAVLGLNHQGLGWSLAGAGAASAFRCCRRDEGALDNCCEMFATELLAPVWAVSALLDDEVREQAGVAVAGPGVWRPETAIIEHVAETLEVPLDIAEIQLSRHFLMGQAPAYRIREPLSA